MSKAITSGPYRTFRALNPDESYVEYEGSTITIPMRGRRSPKEPWLEETIKLRAHMRLEVYPPYVNNLGTREFQFTIRDWDLYGKSPMLNQLFFGDPRGKLVVDEKTGLADYVPAVVTFTVSHHNSLHVEGDDSGRIRELFGPDSAIEIRNLTSHHTRVWTPYDESDFAQVPYGNSNNKIYWQILPPERLKEANLTYLLDEGKARGLDVVGAGGGPMVVFHKKAPDIPGDVREFDLADAQDRARYLLGVGISGPSKDGEGARMSLRSVLPNRGLRSTMVQLRANSVVSPLHRPRHGLDIRMPLSSHVKSADDLRRALSEVVGKSDGGIIKGHIQIVSPAKSLCTASQAPDVGFDIDSADFPAQFIYAANYDIYINNHRFVEDQSGIAIAFGAEEAPPVDVKVAFEKPQAGHVASRYLEFSDGTCTGMMEIAVEEYYAGLNFSRYWRTVPLEPDDIRLTGGKSRFADYDSDFEY